MTRGLLRDLFNPPQAREIGGCDFAVTRLGYEVFEDALTIGPWVAGLDERLPLLEQLQPIKPGAPIGQALHRMLAHSLAVRPTPDDAPVQLTPDDVRAMPLLMQAEALAVVMEVNADFFFRTIASLSRMATRLGWTGSALLSSSSAPATSPPPSGDTPSPSSAGS